MADPQPDMQEESWTDTRRPPCHSPAASSSVSLHLRKSGTNRYLATHDKHLQISGHSLSKTTATTKSLSMLRDSSLALHSGLLTAGRLREPKGMLGIEPWSNAKQTPSRGVTTPAQYSNQPLTNVDSVTGIWNFQMWHDHLGLELVPNHLHHLKRKPQP